MQREFIVLIAQLQSLWQVTTEIAKDPRKSVPVFFNDVSDVQRLHPFSGLSPVAVLHDLDQLIRKLRRCPAVKTRKKGAARFVEKFSRVP